MSLIKKVKKRPSILFMSGALILAIFAALFYFSATDSTQAAQPQEQDQSTLETSVRNASYTVTVSPEDQNAKTLSAQPATEYQSLTIPKNSKGEYYSKAEFISPEIAAPTPTNLVGLKWRELNLPEGTKIKIAVRGKNKDAQWEDIWFETEADNKDSKDGSLDSQEKFSLPFIFEYQDDFQYKVILESASPKLTPEVGDFELVLIDSSKEPEGLSTPINPTATSGPHVPAICDRNCWGADPSWMTWTPQYVTTQKLILHHTAGCSYPSDPKATIRGIYHYHAISLGWGDIGYNFLVDHNGTIYEGRYGGESVVGGHAYGYNYGSAGVVFIGYTHPSGYPSYCSGGPTGLPTAARSAIVKIGAWKSIDYNLDPLGSSYFVDRTTPNIAGHRDYNSTSCPGDYFYSDMQTIRNETNTLKNQLLPLVMPPIPPSGSFVKGSAATVYRVEGGLKTPISSGDIFETWADWGDIQEIEDDDLAIYPDSGRQLHLNNGTLAKTAANPTVYLIEDGLKRAFNSEAALALFGYTVDDARIVNSADLALSSNGKDITTSIQQELPSGAYVVTSGGPTVYKIEGGLKRPFTSAAIFETHGKWSEINAIDQSLLDQHPTGEVMSIADGSLVQGSSAAIYYVENGYRRPFRSWSDYTYFSLQSSGRLKRVSNSDLNLSPVGRSINTEYDRVLANSFVKGSGASVYYFEGKKQKAPRAEIFLSYANWSEIILTPNAVLDDLQTGSPITFDTGSIIKGPSSPAVYYIENGTKRHFETLQSFENRGFSWSRLIVTDQTTVDNIPSGPALQ